MYIPNSPESIKPKLPENNFKKEKRRPEYGKPVENLNRALAEMSKKINARVWEEYGLKNLLNFDGSIYQMEYRQLHGDQKILADLDEVKRREISFSGADDPEILKSPGLTATKRITEWKKNKQESISGQMEMAMTLLLHKFLKDKFLVVRTTDIDDYNGVDNLVIDLESGEVVGAFDDVNQDIAGKRLSDKIKKIKTKALQGGAHIDYGLSLDQGQLKRSKLENLPVFYLGLLQSELEKLLNEMNYDLDDQISAIERQTYNNLIESLESQQNDLIALGNLKPELKQKLEAFTSTLNILKQLGQASQQVTE